jgi:hypothetical protein
LPDRQRRVAQSGRAKKIDKEKRRDKKAEKMVFIFCELKPIFNG